MVLCTTVCTHGMHTLISLLRAVPSPRTSKLKCHLAKWNCVKKKYEENLPTVTQISPYHLTHAIVFHPSLLIYRCLWTITFNSSFWTIHPSGGWQKQEFIQTRRKLLPKQHHYETRLFIHIPHGNHLSIFEKVNVLKYMAIDPLLNQKCEISSSFDMWR